SKPIEEAARDDWAPAPSVLSFFSSLQAWLLWPCGSMAPQPTPVRVFSATFASPAEPPPLPPRHRCLHWARWQTATSAPHVLPLAPVEARLPDQASLIPGNQDS